MKLLIERDNATEEDWERVKKCLRFDGKKYMTFDDIKKKQIEEMFDTIEDVERNRVVGATTSDDKLIGFESFNNRSDRVSLIIMDIIYLFLINKCVYIIFSFCNN